MLSYDDKAPQFHIASRGNVSCDLLPSIFPKDRASWDKDSQVLSWPAHLQRQHASITKAIIDCFGRYPHRNAISGRSSPNEQSAFLKNNPGF